jgi:hypothetical protein
MKKPFFVLFAMILFSSCNHTQTASETQRFEDFAKPEATKYASDFRQALMTFQTLQLSDSLKQGKTFPISFGNEGAMNIRFVENDNRFVIGVIKAGDKFGEHTFVYNEEDSTAFYFNDRKALVKTDFKSFHSNILQAVKNYEEQHSQAKASL